MRNVINGCCYSKEIEMKLMLCETLTQQYVDRNEVYKFSFDESYVQEGKRSVPEQSWTTIHNFLWNEISTNHAIMTIIYWFFFNNFNNWFSIFSKMKMLLKEKHCSLFKKELHRDGESEENQKLTNQAINKNPNQSFNGNKNNKQTKLVFSIAWEKWSFK